LRDSLGNLQRAVGKLEEALSYSLEQPLVAEGTVQRFEFVIELFWKTFKRALEFEGRMTKTPRESVKEAFAAGWITDETVWLDMIQCRNETSHLYLHPELVTTICGRIAGFRSEIRSRCDFLVARYL